MDSEKGDHTMIEMTPADVATATATALGVTFVDGPTLVASPANKLQDPHTRHFSHLTATSIGDLSLTPSIATTMGATLVWSDLKVTSKKNPSRRPILDEVSGR
jgi:hypothetical protein